ncbi:MAG: hypothetical protein K2Y32_24310 [Candidatus Obscuribacterales bacterium]|jgi:hypothetical protein|nr:hypothetical protein [Candidatus Obscuribacterales bacterium]
MQKLEKLPQISCKRSKIPALTCHPMKMADIQKTFPPNLQESVEITFHPWTSVTKPQGGLEQTDQQRLIMVRYDGKSNQWKFTVYPLHRNDFEQIKGIFFEKAGILLKTFLLKHIPPKSDALGRFPYLIISIAKDEILTSERHGI